jgi:predicted nucleotidyltransferase
MGLPDAVKAKRQQILTIAVRHGARNVRLVGSVARGEADERSDVDRLVDMEPGRSLLDHAALSTELNRLLNGKVDVISERGLKPRRREPVLKEAL